MSTLRFEPTELAGVLAITFERVSDERGWFARVYDEDVFAARELCTAFPHHGQARNTVRGTIRGLHWQSDPYAEIKVIRCTAGAAFDVLVDVREESATYGKWAAFELRAEIAGGLYVPAGIAHGYQTLEDATELQYLLSERYRPDAARGIAYDSRELAIAWPQAPTVISDRDRALPPFLRGRRPASESL
jgi:dTDP-4-dehydrorhamnose 3,5-epimerase